MDKLWIVFIVLMLFCNSLASQQHSISANRIKWKWVWVPDSTEQSPQLMRGVNRHSSKSEDTQVENQRLGQQFDEPEVKFQSSNDRSRMENPNSQRFRSEASNQQPSIQQGQMNDQWPKQQMQSPSSRTDQDWLQVENPNEFTQASIPNPWSNPDDPSQRSEQVQKDKRRNWQSAQPKQDWQNFPPNQQPSYSIAVDQKASPSWNRRQLQQAQIEDWRNSWNDEDPEVNPTIGNQRPSLETRPQFTVEQEQSRQPETVEKFELNQSPVQKPELTIGNTDQVDTTSNGRIINHGEPLYEDSPNPRSKPRLLNPRL